MKTYHWQVANALRVGYREAIKAGLSEEGSRAVGARLALRVVKGERFDVLSTIAQEVEDERAKKTEQKPAMSVTEDMRIKWAKYAYRGRSKK